MFVVLNYICKKSNVKTLYSVHYLSIKLHSIVCYSLINVHRIAGKLNNARYTQHDVV